MPQGQYYFDSKYLLQYVDSEAKLKVFVNGQWLSIADKTDVDDPSVGVGYTNSGNSVIFDYRDIEQVKAGKNQMTLDQLQTSKQQKQTPTEPTKSAPEKEPPVEGEPSAQEPDQTEAPPEEEPNPEEEEPTGKPQQKASYDPYMLGRNILKESTSRPKKSEIGSLVKILSREFKGRTGIIVESFKEDYEIRLMSGQRGTFFVDKKDVKFL